MNENFGLQIRLTAVSPLHFFGKPCSIGTHNEAVEKLNLFSAFIKGIVMESHPAR